MALPTATQGSTNTSPTITWTVGNEPDSDPLDLTGATITAAIYDLYTGVSRAAAGTFATDETVPEGGTESPAQQGLFTWTYDAADTADAGDFLVTFKATYTGGVDYTVMHPWVVERIITVE